MLLMIFRTEINQHTNFRRGRGRGRGRGCVCERERELETAHSDLDTSKRAYLNEFLLVHEFDQDGDQSDQIPQLQLNPLHLRRDYDPLHVIRLLVEIWQLLPSLWYCVQVYCHGGCMRNGSNEWNEGLPGFIGIGVREMTLEALVSNFSLPLLCKNGVH